MGTLERGCRAARGVMYKPCYCRLSRGHNRIPTTRPGVRRTAVIGANSERYVNRYVEAYSRRFMPLRKTVAR